MGASSGSATLPSSTRVRPESAVVPDLTVADADALDCGVCFLPLKPPIFQCDVGHVVCSPCGDKLKGAGRCHVCGVALAGGYRRCHAMERVVDSVRAPCPHAPYDCHATPAYHGREEHLLACPHAPCRCPGDEACGFAGSAAALLDHVAGAHGWPRTAEVQLGSSSGSPLELVDGFNFVTGYRAPGEDGAHGRFLFLLNVSRQPLGRAVSRVRALHPPSRRRSRSRKEITCSLAYSRLDAVVNHYQQSEIRVDCTDLSDGLPDPNSLCKFFLPMFARGDDAAGDAIKVTLWLSVDLD